MAARITDLPNELIREIANHILADDVVDYINFRAACTTFRLSLPDPRNLGFCFLPQSLVKLSVRTRFRIRNDRRSFIFSNQIEFNSHEPHHRSFIHLPTGRQAKLFLPELETHSTLFAANGLLILANRQTRAMHLYNPLTRFLSADLPPINKKEFSAATAVAPTSSTVEQPTLMIALCDTNSGYFVKPGEQDSVHKQLPFSIPSALFFKGRFYCTNVSGSIWEIEPEQKLATCVFSQDVPYRCWDLVQTRTEMLLIDSERILEGKIEDAGHNLRIYKVDLSAKTIIATNDIGNYPIFVGDTVQRQQVLSVIPTDNYIEPNTIYVCCQRSYFYRLKDGSTEHTSHTVDKYCLHISYHCNKWHCWHIIRNSCEMIS